jgi:hypothetical protein
MSYSSPDRENRRLYSRRVCSVLSQIFATSGASRRYIGPGSSARHIGIRSGARDGHNPPAADVPLFIKNPYFEVEAEIRNRTAKDDGTRLGLEFTSAVIWHRQPDTLPPNQPSSAGTHSLQPLPVPGSPETRRYDPYAVYRKFLDLLGEARRKLPANVRMANYRRETDPRRPEPPFRCDLCKTPLAEPAAFRMSQCTSLFDATPVSSRQLHLQ